jgi:integrase
LLLINTNALLLSSRAFVIVKKIRFHDLRHTRATMMLQLGEYPKDVSERLGHSSIEMATNAHSHVTPDMQQESSGRFERALKKLHGVK